MKIADIFYYRIGIKVITLLLLFALSHCTEEETTDQLPFIILNDDDEYTATGERIPVGGQLKFGISAVGGGAAITDLRVKRTMEDETITELDRGMYIATGGLDTLLIYTKSSAEQETWNFFIMNENRDTSSVSVTIFLGDGSAYGPIFHYQSITLGYPTSTEHPHFLDLKTGSVYQQENVIGHEPDIDLATFFYFTSGKPSPTLTCPAYPSAQTWYPVFADWPVKNSTLFDYMTVDNDLVTHEQFDQAENDSLLVSGYKPQNVSGLCKFCYTGKVVPFKTANGKYGMVKVVRADELDNGSMEIEVKIQQ